MQKAVVMAEIRENVKKKGAKKLRKEGYVPAIIYGNNIENKNIKLKKNDVERILNHYEVGSSVELNIGDIKTSVIIRDIQRHITKQNIIHIDFQELVKGEKVRVKIPIHIVNKTAVESSTSVVQEQLNEIEIQTIPKYLPQVVEVDAEILKTADAIKVSDLDIYKNENIEVLTEPNQIIAVLANTTKQEVVEKEEESLSDLY
ncbi:50S ribosomal protein L25 [Caminicella sporogenes]|uniref:50S ribosomal protein L25 n=1 Tax=Caminicella sporogenes TaxID=166485 RepID=UPI00254095FC|nr:50S ribosomal protein L25 [Caminicella sporogenes]WIF95923.1 50S ribosomal protein L25 [Caminicella sporogenes]